MDGIDILVTAGEPAGVGPEILLKAWKKLWEDFGRIPFVPIGCCRIMTVVAERLSLPVQIVGVDRADYHAGEVDWDGFSAGVMGVVDIGLDVDADSIITGADSATGGKCAVDSIFCAWALAEQDPRRALVTAPISKAGVKMAGYPFRGHTDLLASLFGAERFGMMFVTEDVKLMLVTVHVSLSDAIRSLTMEKVYEKILLLRDTLVGDFAIPRPEIAVMGLNPHEGETGEMGSEEREIISPAIRRAEREGVNVSGPWGFERLFTGDRYRNYSGIVAMYHDQGIMPMKLLFPGRAVNYTAGLSIVRTSVDHGTAYDIAGKGVADPGPLMEAIRWAGCIRKNRSGPDDSRCRVSNGSPINRPWKREGER